MQGICDIDVELPTLGHIHSQVVLLRYSSVELGHLILEEFLRRVLDVTSIETEPIRALCRCAAFKIESVQQLVIVGLIERVLEILEVFPPAKRVGACPGVIAEDTVRVDVWTRIRSWLGIFSFLQDQHEDQC